MPRSRQKMGDLRPVDVKEDFGVRKLACRFNIMEHAIRFFACMNVDMDILDLTEPETRHLQRRTTRELSTCMRKHSIIIHRCTEKPHCIVICRSPES